VPIPVLWLHELRREEEEVSADLCLDIGCDSRKLSPEHIGLDILNVPGIDVRGSADALPFKDGSFASVYSRRCIQHVWNDGLAISEAHRVLRSGGSAKVVLASWWGWLLYKIIPPFLKRSHSVFHLYTSRELIGMFARCGFRSVNVSRIGSVHGLGYDFVVEARKEG
jgi:SAM-dependent methyltransferase